MEGVIDEQSQRRSDWDLSDSRDELNLAEFPLSCMADRAPKGVKTLVFEDEVWDSGKNEMVARKLTIAGSDDYGLPTALDEDVLVFLMKLTKQANGFTDPKVHFSRSEVIQLLGWDDGGKSFKRLDESLHRWAGVTLRFKRAWWDKRGQRWKDQSFHVLESVELCGREYASSQMSLPLSSFTWNGVLFSSFQSGYMKRLDLEVYKQLRLSGSRRAYRFLDKRFYHKPHWEFPMREFACDHIGLARSYDNANLKRKLRSIIEELVDVGFIEPRSEQDMFVRVSHGDWRVVFEKKHSSAMPLYEAEEQSHTCGVQQELESRGVSSKVAAELSLQFAPEKVQEKLELFDWFLARNDKRMGENPAGFLVKAIREDYVLPKGFKTTAKREEEQAASASKKARAAAEKDLKETLRKRAEENRRQPLWDYWNGLSAEEQSELELEAVEQSDSFRRKRYLASQQSGNLESAAMYREMILLDHIERVVLKLVPSEEEIAALE